MGSLEMRCPESDQFCHYSRLCLAKREMTESGNIFPEELEVTMADHETDAVREVAREYNKTYCLELSVNALTAIVFDETAHPFKSYIANTLASTLIEARAKYVGE